MKRKKGPRDSHHKPRKKTRRKLKESERVFIARTREIIRSRRGKLKQLSPEWHRLKRHRDLRQTVSAFSRASSDSDSNSDTSSSDDSDSSSDSSNEECTSDSDDDSSSYPSSSTEVYSDEKNNVRTKSSHDHSSTSSHQPTSINDSNETADEDDESLSNQSDYSEDLNRNLRTIRKSSQHRPSSSSQPLIFMNDSDDGFSTSDELPAAHFLLSSNHAQQNKSKSTQNQLKVRKTPQTTTNEAGNNDSDSSQATTRRPAPARRRSARVARQSTAFRDQQFDSSSESDDASFSPSETGSDESEQPVRKKRKGRTHQGPPMHKFKKLRRRRGRQQRDDPADHDSDVSSNPSEDHAPIRKMKTVENAFVEHVRQDIREEFVETIRDTVIRMARIKYEACRALNGFLLWCLENDHEIPAMEQLQIQHIFRGVIARAARFGHPPNPARRNPVSTALLEDYLQNHYSTRRPVGLRWTTAFGLGSTINNCAKEFQTNIGNHYKDNFMGKLQQYIGLEFFERFTEDFTESKRKDGIAIILNTSID